MMEEWVEELKLSKNNDDKTCTPYSIVLVRGHIKISKCHSHSAGLFDFYTTLTYSVTIE